MSIVPAIQTFRSETYLGEWVVAKRAFLEMGELDGRLKGLCVIGRALQEELKVLHLNGIQNLPNNPRNKEIFEFQKKFVSEMSGNGSKQEVVENLRQFLSNPVKVQTIYSQKKGGISALEKGVEQAFQVVFFIVLVNEKNDLCRRVVELKKSKKAVYNQLPTEAVKKLFLAFEMATVREIDATKGYQKLLTTIERVLNIPGLGAYGFKGL